MKELKKDLKRFIRSHPNLIKIIKSKNTVFALMLIFCVCIGILTYGSVKVLAVSADGKTEVYRTTCSNIEDFLNKKGITWAWHDILDVQKDGSHYTVTITRSFPVTLIADECTTTEWVTGGTVEDILSKNSVTLGEKDYLNCEESDLLTDGMEIKLTRVNEDIYTEYEDIPFDTKTIDVYYAAKDKAPSNVAGKKGVLEVKKRNVYVDGVLTDTEIISKTVIKKPSQAIKYNVIKPPSKLVNGQELNYTRVLNMRATSYTVTNGIYMTATGAKAQVGCVAINPKICTDLKLGDRLYIETSDGSWIYGYATINDVGGMPAPDLIDVYLPSLTDCYSWGLRNVKVYVLE